MGLHDIIKQICHHFFFLYQLCDAKTRWAIEVLAHPPNRSQAEIGGHHYGNGGQAGGAAFTVNEGR
jgi:hypothetical protein